MGDFDTYYPSNPWENLDKNQRTWYDPDLIAMWRTKSIYSQTIPFKMNNAGVNAKTMVVTQLFDPHPNFNELGLRQMWMPASHVDSRQIEITFTRAGGKVAYHRFDDLITYWRQNRRGGVRRILQGALGQHMVDVNDYLARNAYLDGAADSGYQMIMGGGSDFSDIGTSDVFDPEIAMDIWLGMTYRGVPLAQGVNGAGGDIICYTSPGVLYNIQKDSDYINAAEYADAVRLLNYEVGRYKNVRFVQTPRATLWNCGTVDTQTTITAAISAGDGAPDPASTKVDGTYGVGQDGATHYVTVAAATGFTVGDMVTLHTLRTSDFGITDGVDYRDGTLHNLRIVAISGTHISFDRPVMLDFSTDLGSGVYAYLTKGRHIHASVFVAAPTGIVAGVAQAPRMYNPPPVDDFEAMQRFSWDQYLGYQTFNPEVFEVVFSAGATRIKGDTVAA